MHKKKKPEEEKTVKPGGAKRQLNVSVIGNPKLNKPEKKKSS